MKYSLRSLMTFSIRDLALVTVIVAVCVAWRLDHRRLMSRLRVERVFETDSSGLIKAGGSNPLPVRRLHTSQAPAPNPPKP